jgi:hypothetical protein
MKLVVLSLLALALPFTVAAQNQTKPAAQQPPAAAGQNQSPHQIQPDWNRARDYTAKIPGALDWDLLQQAELMNINQKGPRKSHVGEPGKGGVFGTPPEDEEGAKWEVVFGKPVQKLDGAKVKVAGFMLPIQQTEKHTRFLLSAVPPSCPFCLPGGPNSTIEVLCKTPIKFSTDAMVLNGTMNLLRDDPSGFYYRLTEAIETQ